ncbi:WhiB family transcriptional regulator [Streptomyces sp. NPDC058762]|uniref:WhiB family transcriptional regulator n=1 Tax=Streptomyces sp. NPDC058762 TaxID=3346629 RepID=UPI00369DC37D
MKISRQGIVRPGEWKRHAACTTPAVDPDDFHAGEADRVATDRAKAICSGCPVKAECLTAAYEENDGYAVRGGQTSRQRLYFLRKNGGNVPRAVAEATGDVTVLLRHIYEQHTKPVGDGHVVWTDSRHFLTVRQQHYTVHQLAWRAVHGAAPYGSVQRMCGREGCVAKQCLTDRRMRDRAWAERQASKAKQAAA